MHVQRWLFPGWPVRQHPQVTSSCTDGTAAGNVTAFSEMNVTPGGITMNFTAPSTNAGSKGCTLNGSMIGIRQ